MGKTGSSFQSTKKRIMNVGVFLEGKKQITVWKANTPLRAHAGPHHLDTKGTKQRQWFPHLHENTLSILEGKVSYPLNSLLSLQKKCFFTPGPPLLLDMAVEGNVPIRVNILELSIFKDPKQYIVPITKGLTALTRLYQSPSVVILWGTTRICLYVEFIAYMLSSPRLCFPSSALC